MVRSRVPAPRLGLYGLSAPPRRWGRSFSHSRNAVMGHRKVQLAAPAIRNTPGPPQHSGDYPGLGLGGDLQPGTA
jgi:hypothetical protein